MYPNDNYSNATYSNYGNYGFAQSPNYNTYSQFRQPVYQTQQPQAVMQQRFLAGRMVNSLEEITANDVPMDGTVGYFPSSDGMSIYAKTWNQNGTISTIRYVPEVVRHMKTIRLQNVISHRLAVLKTELKWQDIPRNI